MGARMPGAAPQPQAQGGGQAAELVSNVNKGLEAVSKMVGSQFGEEAGGAIAQLQQQFQEIMLSVGKQQPQQAQAPQEPSAPVAAPGGQAVAAPGAVAPGPNVRV